MGYKADIASAPRSGRQVLVTLPSYKGSVWFPAWDTEKFVPTVFMPFGVPNADLTGYEPWRTGPGPQEYGDWIKAVPMFRGGTTNRVTFIAGRRDPVTGAWLADKTPAHWLYDAFDRMKHNPQFAHIKVLGEGGKGKSPAIDQVKVVALMQGAILEHNGKNYLEEPKFPAVLALTTSAAGSLEEQLDMEVEGYTGDPMDYASRFKAGDVVNPDGCGKLFRIYNSKTSPGQAAAASSGVYRATWNRRPSGSGQQQGGKKDREVAYYKVDLLDNVNPHPRISEEDPRLWFDVNGYGFQPWETILNLDLSDEQMVNLLCDAFEDYPELLMEAFAERGLLSDAWYEKQERAQANRERMAQTAERAKAARTAQHQAAHPQAPAVPGRPGGRPAWSAGQQAPARPAAPAPQAQAPQAQAPQAPHQETAPDQGEPPDDLDYGSAPGQAPAEDPAGVTAPPEAEQPQEQPPEEQTAPPAPAAPRPVAPRPAAPPQVASRPATAATPPAAPRPAAPAPAAPRPAAPPAVAPQAAQPPAAAPRATGAPRAPAWGKGNPTQPDAAEKDPAKGPADFAPQGTGQFGASGDPQKTSGVMEALRLRRENLAKNQAPAAGQPAPAAAG